ncbi:unnamed protein product [Closterium sp. NIES-54]
MDEPCTFHTQPVVLSALPSSPHGFTSQVVDADKLFNLVSNYGNVVRIKFLHNKPDHALVQLADGLQAELAVTYLKVCLVLVCVLYALSVWRHVVSIKFLHNKPDHALVQLANGLQAELAVTYLKVCLVLVCVLYALSVWRHVVSIKFLHNKPDHARVQLADGLQAELAATYLKVCHMLPSMCCHGPAVCSCMLFVWRDGVIKFLVPTLFTPPLLTGRSCVWQAAGGELFQGAAVFGKRLEVNYSKYPSINPSADTKDYSTSNLNRFGRNAPKNYRHCCAPTRMLHCSNLPADASADMVVEHMAPHGPVLGSKVIDKDGKKQVLVLFETVEAATDALVAKHATPIGGQVIRLAFSKSQNL